MLCFLLGIFVLLINYQLPTRPSSRVFRLHVVLFLEHHSFSTYKKENRNARFGISISALPGLFLKHPNFSNTTKHHINTYEVLFLEHRGSVFQAKPQNSCQRPFQANLGLFRQCHQAFIFRQCHPIPVLLLVVNHCEIPG